MKKFFISRLLVQKSYKYATKVSNGLSTEPSFLNQANNALQKSTKVLLPLCCLQFISKLEAFRHRHLMLLISVVNH